MIYPYLYYRWNSYTLTITVQLVLLEINKIPIVINNCEKKVLKVMVNASTNINNKTLHLSLKDHDTISLLDWDRGYPGTGLRQGISRYWIETGNIQVLDWDREYPGTGLRQGISRYWIETGNIQVLDWDREYPGTEFRQGISRYWIERGNIQVLDWDRGYPGTGLRQGISRYWIETGDIQVLNWDRNRNRADSAV